MLITNYDAVAAIRITEADGRVIKQFIKYTAKSPNYSLAYSPDSFRVYNRKYTFHFPLRCGFTLLNNAYTITCDLLAIAATGNTPADAEKNFCYAFHELYENAANSEQTKIILKAVVKEVAQW
jgi:hypothetical protein